MFHKATHRAHPSDSVLPPFSLLLVPLVNPPSFQPTLDLPSPFKVGASRLVISAVGMGQDSTLKYERDWPLLTSHERRLQGEARHLASW